MTVRRYIYNYLKKTPCRCGESDVCCLTFHHLVPSQKKFNISQASRSKHITLKVIKQEISKCEVLCLNCHAKVTSKEQNWYKNLK